MKEESLIPIRQLDDLVKRHVLQNANDIFGKDISSGEYGTVEIRSAHIVNALLVNKGDGPDKSVLGSVGSLNRRDFLALVLSMYDADGDQFMEDFKEIKKNKEAGDVTIHTNTMNKNKISDEMDLIASASSMIKKLFSKGKDNAKRQIFDALEKEVDRAEFLTNFVNKAEENPLHSSLAANLLVDGLSKDIIEKFEEDGHEDKIIYYTYFVILIACRIHAYCMEKYPNKEDYPDFIHGMFEYTHDVIKDLKNKKIIDSDDIPL